MASATSSDVLNLINGYPQPVRDCLLSLRKLITDTARKTQGVGELEETLKWGQPSYLCKSGSTIRIDRLKAQADRYAMYFHCQTKLIDTFKEIYGHELVFDGNRAIIFNTSATVPKKAITHCIALALTYHKVKHLPMLGA